MLLNHFILALRTLGRKRLYTFINIAGLGVGLAAFIFILLYVQHELSHDRSPSESDRTYRVTRYVHRNGNMVASNVPQVAPLMVEHIPEVVMAGRIGDISHKVVVENGGKRFNEGRLFFADPEILKLFEYSLSGGSPNALLSEPNSIVLTRAMAEKYFGEENPVGKSLVLHAGEGDELSGMMNVTGVVETEGLQSHFQFDFLISFSTLGDVYSGNGMTGYGWTYVLLDERASPDVVQEKTNRLFSEMEFHRSLAMLMQNVDMRLQPLEDIHLHSELTGEIGLTGDIRQVYLFSLIAVLILLVACVNYMNLATVLSGDRAREIGVRKSLGASRYQVAGRFLSETFLISLMSIAIAFLAVELFLPRFNTLMDVSVQVNYLQMIPVLLTLMAGTAALAGLYPSLYLSSFEPTAALKGRGDSRRGGTLWKGLTVFQFVLSIGLIISALVIHRQTEYISAKNLGFEKEQVLYLAMEDETISEQSEILVERFSALPDVVEATRSMDNPIDMRLFTPQNVTIEGQEVGLQHIFVDFDFLETMQIPLVAGRSFSRETPGDADRSVLVNRTLVEWMGWENPIGKSVPPFFTSGGGRTVVGVVEDFHYTSLYDEIHPAVLEITPMLFNTILVRMDTQEISETLASMEQVWQEMVPYRPFEYVFLDDAFAKLYQRESRIGQLFWVFTAISILIACMGLVGLSSHYAQRRTKELGIRKVLGAGSPGLMVLLSSDFLKPVLLAWFISIPIAWYATSQWLSSFAYRMDPGAGVILLAGASAIAIAILAISWQTWRAVRLNPADCLRDE